MNQIKRRVKIITKEDEMMVARLQMNYKDYNIKRIYEWFKDNPKVKWKDSIKKVVGIETPKETGMDI